MRPRILLALVFLGLDLVAQGESDPFTPSQLVEHLAGDDLAARRQAFGALLRSKDRPAARDALRTLLASRERFPPTLRLGQSPWNTKLPERREQRFDELPREPAASIQPLISLALQPPIPTIADTYDLQFGWSPRALAAALLGRIGKTGDGIDPVVVSSLLDAVADDDHAVAGQAARGLHALGEPAGPAVRAAATKTPLPYLVWLLAGWPRQARAFAASGLASDRIDQRVAAYRLVTARRITEPQILRPLVDRFDEASNHEWRRMFHTLRALGPDAATALRPAFRQSPRARTRAVEVLAQIHVDQESGPRPWPARILAALAAIAAQDSGLTRHWALVALRSQPLEATDRRFVHSELLRLTHTDQVDQQAACLHLGHLTDPRWTAPDQLDATRGALHRCLLSRDRRVAATARRSLARLGKPMSRSDLEALCTALEHDRTLIEDLVPMFAADEDLSDTMLYQRNLFGRHWNRSGPEILVRITRQSGSRKDLIELLDRKRAREGALNALLDLGDVSAPTVDAYRRRWKDLPRSRHREFTFSTKLPVAIVQPMIDSVLAQRTNGQHNALNWLADRGEWTEQAVEVAIEALRSDRMRTAAAAALQRATAAHLLPHTESLRAMLSASDHETRFAAAGLLRHHQIPPSVK